MSSKEWKRIERKLGKSPLVSFGWTWRHPFFGRFRFANAKMIQLWWLTIRWRAPWLESSARALHPELFAAPTQAGAA